MTYIELLQRLTDLKLLAVPPQPGEQGGCMSSTDRAARYDPETDRYIDWDANNDGDGFIRKKPDGTIVAFEQEGPGVIWRIWSALPESGHICIYIDGHETPAVDMPFIDWFERSPGETPPLNYSELSLRLSRGRNSYIPVPYQKSCRVELKPGWGAYYHFTYTTFPKGTVMPRYEDRFLRESCIALAQTDQLLYDRGEQEPDMPPELLQETILPGEEKVLMQATGHGAIHELAWLPVTADAAVLRGLRLRLRWDGADEPAVDVPVGDFFGGTPGYARVRTLPLTMERSRYACRFYMPFARGFSLTVLNTTAGKQEAHMSVSVCRDVPEAENLLRFHARFHTGDWKDLDRARFAPGGDRWPDWPLLITSGGCGRFCGVHMNICCTWPEPDEPAATWWYGQWDKKNVDWWWGEGDEKFFVDGEKYPSTFGTGSEDYIGYAWAAEPPFARFESSYAAMNAMPLDGNGYTSVMRFHIADAIPFRHSFEAFIEKYKGDQWGNGGICTYAVVPYWYEEPKA